MRFEFQYPFGRPDWNAWTAIGTLLAVVVALFYQPLRRWWNAPKLRVTWRTRDSENQKVDDFGAVATNVRLLVWNRGRTAAQRVELTVADVCRRGKDGSLELITDFLPTALRWTHTEAPRCEYLGPNAKRLCNLGSFFDTPAVDVAPLARAAAKWFVFATEVQPRSDYNRLNTGIYVTRIVATALNCKPDIVTLVINVGPHLRKGKTSSFSIFDAPDEVVAEVDRIAV